MNSFGPHGGHHAATAATSPLDRATALYAAGRYAEAEAEARAVAGSRAWMHNDPYELVARNVVALALGSQGRHAEASAEFDALLPEFARVFGAEHVQVLKLRSDRAQALIPHGRYAECEAECAAVARFLAGRAEPEARMIATAACNGLVYALNAQGRFQEAEAVARDALAVRAVPDRISLVLRLGLARSLNGQARYAEALAEVEEVIRLRREQPGDDSRQETGAGELIVAVALLGLGYVADARARAVTAHDALYAAFGPNHYRTAEARSLLAHLDGA